MQFPNRVRGIGTGGLNAHDPNAIKEMGNQSIPAISHSIHVQRAAACCLATYFNCQVVKDLFTAHEIAKLNFKEVYLSPLPQPEEEGTRQNVLVAIAADSVDETSVYVAFRGNSDLAEIFSDVCPPSEFKMFKDSIIRCGCPDDRCPHHENFCNRLNQLVPRIDGLLDFCRSLVTKSRGTDHSVDTALGSRQLRTRLIFCGHSLGGALSHLVTMACLLSNFCDDSGVPTHRSQEPMSITFGAPLVFGQKAARFLDHGQVTPLHRMFLSCLHAKDPVPFILARIPISGQDQERFRQLKWNHAVSLAATGKSLLDAKRPKFLRRPHAHPVTAERNQLGKVPKAGNSGKRHSTVSSQSQTHGAPADQRVVVGKQARPVASRSRTRKSGAKKKVSDGFHSLIRTVGKIEKAIANVNRGTKNQLESDIKNLKVKTTLTHGGSSANTFAPLGTYMRFSYRRKARGHILEQVKTEEILNHDFKLNKHHLKHHKMGSYIYWLVGQRISEPVNRLNEVIIREGPLPRLGKAEMILIRCKTSKKLMAARIVATGECLSLALESNCQVTTFSDKWRLVAAHSNRIVFETLRETDCQKEFITHGELIEIARVGHGNRATSISVGTIFSRNPSEFFPVLLRDLAADSGAIDGLKHSVGKLLVLLETDGSRAGEVGNKTLHYLQKAAELTGLEESYNLIVQPRKGTVHEKKRLMDKGFIAEVTYELCYKPIMLVFESEGKEKIVQAARIIRKQEFAFFMNTNEGNDELLLDPFIHSLNLRTTPVNKKSDGHVMVELDSYDQILSCLHALVLPHKHVAAYNQGTDVQEYASFIKTYEEDLYEAMKEFYDVEQVLRKDRLMANWFPGLDEISRDCLCRLLELLYFLISAFKVVKEQKLLALMGRENAGKSTLANLLGCRTKQPRGFMIHTADIESYRLAPDLLAVDFPGTDAPGARGFLSVVWEDFAKVPDLCIVVTAFTGDVTEESQELPRLAAEKFCPDVMLLVNRVDGILKGPRKAKIWKQYDEETMKSLRKKFTHISSGVGRVNLKEVVLCCLVEDGLHGSEIEQLKERGIVFPEEAKKKIFEWIGGPKASPFPAPDDVTSPSISMRNYSQSFVRSKGTSINQC